MKENNEGLWLCVYILMVLLIIGINLTGRYCNEKCRADKRRCEKHSEEKCRADKRRCEKHSEEMNLKPQEILQIYMFERLVERLAVSKYKGNFILKGGLLIASMIGIAERTTMDMDTTIQGLPMAEKDMERILKEILGIDVRDGISFELMRLRCVKVTSLEEYGKSTRKKIRIVRV